MKFLIFGKLPPPVGGVTISIKNLTTALNALNLENELIWPRHLLQFKSFDIGHIHYSRKLKVLLAILLSKLLCKKTIVTKHGAGFYPQSNLLDKLILTLSDGLIVLNQEVYQRSKSKKNLIKLAPIFKEGIEKIDENTQSYFTKEADKKYLLLYAGGKVYIDNQEVYGVHFMLNLLHQLPKNICLILVDPSAEYAEEITHHASTNIIYLPQYIDFNCLVQEVDLYLRPTSSDGNSIATLEALSQGTPVLASDVVQRDDNVVTYHFNDQEDFILKVQEMLNQKHKTTSPFNLQSIQKYLAFCQGILQEKETR